MSVLKTSSQITFLYFKEIDKTVDFFEKLLGFERVLYNGWSYIWKVAEKSFIGAVDEKQGSITVDCRGGVLTSIVVNNVEEVYESLKNQGLEDMTELIIHTKIPLKSFFFTGPEGYKFEIQEFTEKSQIETF